MSRENIRLENPGSSTAADEEILHLKRLLVTIKQKYEQALQQMNQQLQSEISTKNSIQNDLIHTQRELSELKKQHEDEHESLIQQQLTLKELLASERKESEAKIRALQEKVINAEEGSEVSTNSSVTPAMLRKIEFLEECVRQQANLQEKYELAKEELTLLNIKFEEALEGRLHAEEQYKQTQTALNSLSQNLQEKEKELESLIHIHQESQSHAEENKRLIEETESKLKTAQQHLAKKVKETALLTEQLNNLQEHLSEQERNRENAQFLISQMQNQIEQLQKQEKKLQEDLHESLKNNELQIAKWEEKYFRMYDKWQESETKNRELSKFEERHIRIQALLSNLNSLMDTSTSLSEQRSHYPEEDYDSFGLLHPPLNTHG